MRRGRERGRGAHVDVSDVLQVVHRQRGEVGVALHLSRWQGARGWAAVRCGAVRGGGAVRRGVGEGERRAPQCLRPRRLQRRLRWRTTMAIHRQKKPAEAPLPECGLHRTHDGRPSARAARVRDLVGDKLLRHSEREVSPSRRVLPLDPRSAVDAGGARARAWERGPRAAAAAYSSQLSCSCSTSADVGGWTLGGSGRKGSISCATHWYSNTLLTVLRCRDGSRERWFDAKRIECARASG